MVPVPSQNRMPRIWRQMGAAQGGFGAVSPVVW
jgi:hypothetical protein